MTDQLRIESVQGRPLMEYRIHHGHIEARVPSGGSEPARNGSWLRLSAREFSAHLAQNPALAEWLRARARQRHPSPTQAQDEAA